MTVDDLPTALGAPIFQPLPLLVELVGPGQDGRAITHLNLFRTDRHGDGRPAPLRPGAEGLPSLSCERWVQLRLVGDSTISRLTLWLPNYAPNPNWDLRIGTTHAYRPPTTAPSTVAVQTPFTSEPGLPIPVTPDGYGWSSDFIVLQAGFVADHDPAYSIQPEPLQFSFSWTEN